MDYANSIIAVKIIQMRLNSVQEENTYQNI